MIDRNLTQFTGQAKVDDLDLRASRVHADNVLRFKVQVDDVLLVDVLDALQDLPHVLGTAELCVFKVLIHEAFEQLSTCDTDQRDETSSVLESSTRSSHWQ